MQFLTVAQQSAMTTRKGSGLEAFADLLIVAFMETSVEFKEKIKKCYKVHFMYEEPKKKKAGSAWLDAPASTKRCRVMNYWCFNPGFGLVVYEISQFDFKFVEKDINNMYLIIFGLFSR